MYRTARADAGSDRHAPQGRYYRASDRERDYRSLRVVRGVSNRTLKETSHAGDSAGELIVGTSCNFH